MREKVAVVTGAMRGVGLGIAQELHDAGASVVITDLDQAGLDDAVSALGPAASGLIADVTDQMAMERTYEEVVRTHGRLDVVVANAARSPCGRDGRREPDRTARKAPGHREGRGVPRE
jgi:NAD(P)-dependent dehydrogenase (short-subunit alcohol dehydrogenase family)